MIIAYNSSMVIKYRGTEMNDKGLYDFGNAFTYPSFCENLKQCKTTLEFNSYVFEDEHINTNTIFKLLMLNCIS